MLEFHPGYNPPSSYGVLFWSGGRPRQFSHLKIFRALIDTGGVFCRGINIEGRQLPSGLPVIFQSWLRRKGGVTGSSVHVIRKNNIRYGQIINGSIYNSRRFEHLHSSTRRYKRRPQGPASVPHEKLDIMCCGIFTCIFNILNLVGKFLCMFCSGQHMFKNRKKFIWNHKLII